MSVEAVQIGVERLRDVDVAYRAAGRDRRVVLIHGLAQDHRMWARQQHALRDCSTLAYDLRGHGDTSLGKADGSLRQLGENLIAFLEHCGPATCVGFSLGGAIVLWAAAQRPKLFDGIVAIATSSVVSRSAAAAIERRIELFEAGDSVAVRDTLHADTLAQLSNDMVDAEAITDERIRAIGDRRGYLNGARAGLGLHKQPLNETLTRIRQPVLLIGCERDVVCPPQAAEIMLEHLPDATYKQLPGVGHLATDDDPAAVTNALREWLG